MYLLNHKRDRLAEIEARYAMRVHFETDDTLVPPAIRIDRLKPQVPESERPQPAISIAAPPPPPPPVDDVVEEEADGVFLPETEAPAAAAAPAPATPRGEPRAASEETERKRRRRRRRRNVRREPGSDVPLAAGAVGDEAEGEGGPFEEDDTDPDEAVPDAFVESEVEAEAAPPAEAAQAEMLPPTDPAAAEQPSLDPTELDENGLPKAGRRRGRRGGRRRRPGESVADEAEVPQPPAPVYAGPTPANPFGNGPLDIFDLLDQHEAAAPMPMPQTVPLAQAPDFDEPVLSEPAGIEPAASEPAASEPAASEPADVIAERLVVETLVTDPEPVDPVPEPVAEAPTPEAPTPEVSTHEVPIHEVPVLEAPAPEAPVAEEPAAQPAPEVVVGPAIQPVVIGDSDTPPAERKRGWWKR